MTKVKIARSAKVIPFPVPPAPATKPKYHFEIYQAHPGGLVSVDGVIPASIATELLRLISLL